MTKHQAIALLIALYIADREIQRVYDECRTYLNANR